MNKTLAAVLGVVTLGWWTKRQQKKSRQGDRKTRGRQEWRERQGR